MNRKSPESLLEVATASFLPAANLARLRLRAALMQRLRAFFDQRQFFEVTTPILSADSVIDHHLDPVSVPLGPDRTMYLQTSPEFAMKRILAAGAAAIYQICPAIRQEEQGQFHNLEFTIAEWYRVGDNYQAGRNLLSDLIVAMLDCELPEQRSYQQVFKTYLGVDPLVATPGALAEIAGTEVQFDLSASTATDDLLDYLLATRIQPQLQTPTILFDYPASQAALARISPEDQRVAERFELFVGGVELANGYHELVDAEALRVRNERNRALRARDGKPSAAVESRLMAAMRAGALPACSGVALGFDRLVMVVAGVTDIREVLPFPLDRA